MLKEKRQLLFNYEQVFEAINLQRQNYGDSLISDKNILSLKRNPENKEEVIIALKDQSKHEVQRASLAEDLLIEGLVLFCVKNKIPFPQSGKKSVDLKKNKVILCNFMDPKADS